MFHATISTETCEPLHFSGQVAPYDLQVLREHVLAAAAAAPASRCDSLPPSTPPSCGPCATSDGAA